MLVRGTREDFWDKADAVCRRAFLGEALRHLAEAEGEYATARRAWLQAEAEHLREIAALRAEVRILQRSLEDADA